MSVILSSYKSDTFSRSIEKFPNVGFGKILISSDKRCVAIPTIITELQTETSVQPFSLTSTA